MPNEIKINLDLKCTTQNLPELKQNINLKNNNINPEGQISNQEVYKSAWMTRNGRRGFIREGTLRFDDTLFEEHLKQLEKKQSKLYNLFFSI